MTAPHDADRLIRAYLDDGPIQLADRSFDAVREGIERTHQRGGFVPWRTHPVNTYAKLVTAAAAVVLVAVLGVSLIPGVGSVGGPGTSATPTPTSTPTPSAPPLAVGPLAPGRYAWTWSDGRVTFEVPEGWIGRSDGVVAYHEDQPDEAGLIPWLPGTENEVSQVFSDACAPGETHMQIGPTTADLVAALEAQGGMNATVTELEIGGYPASRVDAVLEPEVDPATCRHGPDGPIQIWQQEPGGYLAIGPASDRALTFVIWSVDVDGERLIFTSGTKSTTDLDAFAEVEAMIASMAFE